MYLSKRLSETRFFQIFASFLLIFSMLTSAIPPTVTFADDSENGNHKEDHGSISNGDEIDYDRATINKQVSFGDKPGEYFIDLMVKGKDNTAIETTDVVLVYDNSNSMNAVMGGGTRATVAKDATTNFLNGLLASEGNKFQFALVTYGSSIFDGVMNQTWANNPGVTANHSYKQFTNVAANLTNKLPSLVPSDNGHAGKTWHGGTFTQQALVEAGNILSTSNADHKIIVTITDGAPTLSYINGTANTNQNIRGDGTSFTYGNGNNYGTPTIQTASGLQQSYEMYTIGVGLKDGDSGAGATAEQVQQVINGLSTNESHAYLADTVPEMVDALNDISQKMSDSVVDGSIMDPITDEFILKTGDYTATASDDSLLEGVTVTLENQEVKVNGLNLGKDEWVNIRYAVQIDTENPVLDPTELYPTNGPTTLTPNGDDPDKKDKFPEPEASAEPVKVSGKKAWADWGYDVHRPDEITLQLVRKIDGEDIVVEEVVVENNDTDVWEYAFEEAVVYDNNGEKINYIIREIMPEGTEDYYVGESGSISGETTDVRNIFQQDAKIQLVKTAKSTSELGEDEIEVGKDINYTFEITNIGNLRLKDIALTDELEGISSFTYEAYNGEPFTGNIEDVVMEPGDVIVATATYEVTQEDYDHGQVPNHAEVVGTPTVPNPDQFGGQMNQFDDTPVKDDDDAAVPGELEPEISLTKTADKESVSEVDEKVTYTFDVTNTGNTTLTDVTLTDDMLGGNITLEKTTLHPGESTTATAEYDVTQADINAEEIVNEAEVEGTPPPAYTNNPDNPDKVTDEDDEIIEATQTSEIELVKEADKEELVADETIKYTFTATNTGNTTLTNVEITDILDGISKIDYLSVNGEPIADANNITLEPGDVLVATATYVVTQDDVDLGQVFNEATVTGIDPKDKEVTDEDDAAVPSNPELGIELVKTSDKQYVTEAGQEIEYTFNVTNTSNVTLVDVKVTDEMLEDLGIEIELEKTTLKPGETTTAKATYTVTEEDIEGENVENIATATGTPPNPTDPPPVDEDKENVPVAKINLEKSSQPGIYTEVGQEVTYTLVVTNTGDIKLNDVTLTDDMLGGGITLDVDSLEPGDSTIVEVPYTVTEADVEAGEILNTATTEGTPEGYDPEDPNTPDKVRDEDNDKVLYSGIVIEKTSDKMEVEEAGETITYTFEVTNTGKTVLENVEVKDDMLAELGIEVELEKTTLEPGESTTGTAEYTVTQEDIDNGGVYNVATSTGTPPGYDPEDPEFPEEPPVSPPDEENVPSKQSAEINLVKSADIDQYTQVGDEVVYTFTVTNTGNTTLTDVKVDDETFRLNVLIKETTLAPGESTTGTYTYTVNQADLDNGEIHNFANTEGTPPPVIDPEDPNNPVAQDPVTDEDDEIVEGEQNKELSLEKIADKQEVEQAGDEITYTLTVTNTGNTTLNNVIVNDEMLGGDLSVTPSTLAPGEQGVVTGTYTVTQEDIDRKDEILNIATATGTPPGGEPEDPDNPTTPPVEEEVPVVNDPKITLVKLADKEKLVEGETIKYTFTATNTGNTTLNKVNLVDELEGISEIEYVTVNDVEIVDPENITLLPGDVLVATATYEVTQADVDANEVYNQATVEGTPPAKDNPEDPENPVAQDPVTDDDDAKVPSEHKPEITLEKSTTKEKVTKAGDTITYNFVVTNTGNVTLDGIRVDDPMLDELGIEIDLEKDKLNPGESTTGSADYTVTQNDIDNKDKIKNIATATGTPPGGDPKDPENPTSPPSEEEVPVEKTPAIDIEKTAKEKEVVKAGDKINYNFVVINTGNVTLKDVKVDDPMLEKVSIEVELKTTTLKPGESTTGSAVYTVTQADIDNGVVKNIATSTGTPPGDDPEDPVSPPDEVEVPAKQKSSISLEKTSDVEKVTHEGQEVTYSFVVTNTGNVTLKDIKLDDPMLDGAISLDKTILKPGEQATGTAIYKVTKEDLNKSEIENIATVEGTPPGYDPEDPESPQKPTDKDNDVVVIEKQPELVTPEKGELLPKTATNIYTLLVIGFTILFAGLGLGYIRRRNQA